MNSNCCNESVIEETDICSKCGEHCEVVEDDITLDELFGIEEEGKEND